MRARAFRAVLTSALAGVVPLIGCQLITNINALQITGGSGGAGGGSSSGTGGAHASSSSSSGSSSNSASSSSSSATSSAGGGSTSCTPNASCTTAGAASKGICLQPPGNVPMCVPCDTTPPNPSCPDAGCASCDNGTCVQACNGACLPAVTLHAGTGPVRFTCNGVSECNALAVTCQGPYPCEVDCDGGCVGLTLTCDQVGPCKLVCGNYSCMNAVVNCGSNACSATCTQMGPGAVNCNGSCDCSPKPTCGP